MDYKKKYEEALERARSMYESRDDAELAAFIFPELAESEDERIRKELWEYFHELELSSDRDFSPSFTIDDILAWLEKQKEQKPIIQDAELNDAVYDYVRDHFIAGADFTPEYIKKLMENAFFAGVDYYLLNQESESCEPDTNVEKVIEDVIRVYGKTQGEWVGGYDVDTLIVNLRRAFNKKEQKHPDGCFTCDEYKKGYEAGRLNGFTAGYNKAMKEQKPAWSEEDEAMRNNIIRVLSAFVGTVECDSNPSLSASYPTYYREMVWLESLRPSWKPSEEQMEALRRVVNKLAKSDVADSVRLSIMYDHLKGLM